MSSKQREIKGRALDLWVAPAKSSALKCARCGKRVSECGCTCPGCGGPSWRFNFHYGEYEHHHCTGGRHV